jgi:transcriptional regulator with XRE-family HTH domain
MKELGTLCFEKALARKIGRTIAKKRSKAKLTQEEVAELLGVGNEAISRIERGVVPPSLARLHELAEIFECGVETFLIEGSRRSTDQAEYIAEMIEPLSNADRQLIISIVERLAKRCSK